MAKVSFSIKLLKLNQKYHKDRLRFYLKPTRSSIYNKYVKGIIKNHQKTYNDLTLAIEILTKKNK